jgi:hypothetical protein
MALKEGTVQPQQFVEEIDYNEIQKLEVRITTVNFRQYVLKHFPDIPQHTC